MKSIVPNLAAFVAKYDMATSSLFVLCRSESLHLLSDAAISCPEHRSLVLHLRRCPCPDLGSGSTATSAGAIYPFESLASSLSSRRIEHKGRPTPRNVQAAEQLGVTVNCLRRWIYRRAVAYVKVGRAVSLVSAHLRRLIWHHIT